MVVLTHSKSCQTENHVSKSTDHATPIFLTGFARSGTTWVNHIFRDYFDVGMVNEGQFILTYGRKLPRYGDLSDPQHRRRLIRDLSRDDYFSILERNYRVTINWSRVLAIQSGFAAIVLEILRQVAEGTGKRLVGSKFPMFGWHLDLINSFFPDCRVVHVIRDGRDCALSQRELFWGHQNTYMCARYWRDYLKKARHDGSKMRNRYFEIRYEDLLTEPETSMRRLEHFITATDDYAGTLHFLETLESSRMDRINKWRQAMLPRAQAIFEAVAGDVLQELGYPLTGVIRPATPLAKACYAIHDRIMRESWYWARRLWPMLPERKRDLFR